MRRSRLSRLTCMLICACLLQGAAQSDPVAEDTVRLVRVLGLGPGRSVADIGAGDGKLALALANVVGPEGQVYATELTDERIGTIRDAAAREKVGNVTVVPAHEARTNLPAACCDALVIRFVYHHFGDPLSMNRSLFESVKPGGRVAVIDFESREGRTAAPGERSQENTHGVDPDTVVTEMALAGFARVLVESTEADRGFLVVMARPE